MSESKEIQLPAQIQFGEGGGTLTAEAQGQMARAFGAIVSAKNFPRNEEKSRDKILKACKRIGLAGQAEYSFPRGGAPVEGPSIRLAEVAAQCWGNVHSGVRELEQHDGKSVMQAYCTDLETNTTETKDFIVPHKRKSHGKIAELKDPRDIYEHTAGQAARRKRSCILGIIPGDIIDDARAACRKTLENGLKPENLPGRIEDMVTAFEKFGVTEEMLNTVSGDDGVRGLDIGGFLKLGRLYRSIVDGMVKPSAVFDIPTATTTAMNEEFSKPKEVKNPDKKPTAKKAEPPATEKPKTDKANDDPKSDFYLFASFETVKNVIIKRDGNDDKYYQILDKFGYKTRKAIIGSDKREEVFGALNWEAATDKSKEEKPEGQENLI